MVDCSVPILFKVLYEIDKHDAREIAFSGEKMLWKWNQLSFLKEK